ncbi:discoidin domain-containing protein, partial [Kitasatospora herbaricolor]|uniref:discoidin domain-containing protein n=1 Tax=Kitasatospora herbaricolor TaxID=68217 RepID=UPI0036DBEB69
DAAGNQSAASPVTAVTLPVDTDLALHKQVTASSFSAGHEPGLAVDGDLSTRWAQGLGLPDPSWIQVDLGTVTSIKSVVTTFELPSGYEYLLEYSADGANWSTFDDHTASRTTDRANYSFLSQPVDARYVRLTVTNSNWNGGSIYGLQVYGGF